MFRRHRPGSSILEKCLKRARPSETRRSGPVVRPSIDLLYVGLNWASSRPFDQHRIWLEALVERRPP
jgi:hypothetical protein